MRIHANESGSGPNTPYYKHSRFSHDARIWAHFAPVAIPRTKTLRAFDKIFATACDLGKLSGPQPVLSGLRIRDVAWNHAWGTGHGRNRSSGACPGSLMSMISRRACAEMRAMG